MANYYSTDTEDDDKTTVILTITYSVVGMKCTKCAIDIPSDQRHSVLINETITIKHYIPFDDVSASWFATDGLLKPEFLPIMEDEYGKKFHVCKTTDCENKVITEIVQVQMRHS
jgi:hypothetical protein